MASSQLVKIHFALDVSDWHGHASESLWAKPLAGPQNMVYELQNSPFFTIGVSYLDIVECRRADDDACHFFKVAKCSGHSTFMVLVPSDTTQFESWWTQLARLGCTYESGHIALSIGERIMYSVDVPDAANVAETRQVLLQGFNAGVWQFQDGHIYAQP